MTGRTVRLWAGPDRVHVLLDGHRIKTLPSRLDTRDLARLAAAGARPAGPPPLPPSSGAGVELERTVNASGNVSLGDCVISAGLPLAGQRVTLRLDGPVAHILSGGIVVRTLACPVPAHARARLRGARRGTAGPPQLPEPLRVQRRVSVRGAIMIGGQRIQVGLPHAGKTAEVTVESEHLPDHPRRRDFHVRTPQDQPRYQTAQSLELRPGQLASPLRALPRITLQGVAHRRRALAEYGLAVRDQHGLRLQTSQAFQGGQITLAPPAAPALAVHRVLPYAQLTAARLDHRVAEDQGTQGGDLDRLLRARRGTDRMKSGHAANVITTAHGLEAGGVAQPRRHFRMPIDACLCPVIAPPQQFSAAGVKGLADQDPNAAADEVIQRAQRRIILTHHQRIHQQRLATDGQRIARPGTELPSTQSPGRRCQHQIPGTISCKSLLAICSPGPSAQPWDGQSHPVPLQR